MPSIDPWRNELQQSSPTPQAPAPTTVKIPQHVVYRGFVSETVVLNLATGKYHGLNPTGGRMLETLEATADLDVAAAILAEEFTVPVEEIRADLRAFCDDLAERGLLEVDDDGAH